MTVSTHILFTAKIIYKCLIVKHFMYRLMNCVVLYMCKSIRTLSGSPLDVVSICVSSTGVGS